MGTDPEGEEYCHQDKSKKIGVTTDPEGEEYCHQVKSKKIGATTDPEGEKQMPSLAPSNNEGTIANVVSNSGDYNLVISNTDNKASIKTYKIRGQQLIKKGYFKEKS